MKEIIEKLNKIESLLKSQNQPQKKVLTFKEASIFLDLSESYMYKMTASRKIPHFSPNNKKLYFKKSELENWLMQNKRESQEEIETKAANYLLKHNRHEKNK